MKMTPATPPPPPHCVVVDIVATAETFADDDVAAVKASTTTFASEHTYNASASTVLNDAGADVVLAAVSMTAGWLSGTNITSM